MLEAPRRRALIAGSDLVLRPGTLPSLMANVAHRVQSRPDGLLRSLNARGDVREETFAKLWQRSDVLLDALLAAELPDATPAIVLIDDLLDHVPACWACMRAGATVVPLAGVIGRSTEDELRDLLSRLHQPVIVAAGCTMLVDRVRALLPDAPIFDAAVAQGHSGARPARAEARYPYLIPTSGSTGQVKLVACAAEALLHRVFAGSRAEAHLDAACLALAPFHGLGGFRALLLRFGSLTQLPSHSLASHPRLVLEAAARFRAISFPATNAMAARLGDLPSEETQGLDLSALKFVGLGGEAVTRAVAVRLRDLLVRLGAPPNVVQVGYGTTETGFVLEGVDPSAGALDESGAIVMGTAVAGVALRIVDGRGALLDEGDVGDVEISAPEKMYSHYWGEPEASRAAFTADGWWRTGDRGAVLDGRFVFRGRSKQTLVVDGRKFSLADIEAHLQSDPAVTDAVVACILRDVAGASDSLGIVVLRRASDGASAAARALDIRASLIRRFGFPPLHIGEMVADEAPLTGTGKYDRVALADWLVTERGSHFSVPDAPVHRLDDARLEALWCECLGIAAAFDRSKTFEDLGGDSLRLATLLSGVESRFGIRMAASEFLVRPDLATFVAVAKASPPAPAVLSEDIYRPLPEWLYRKMVHFVDAWSGEPVTPDRLLRGRNLEGTRVPLFCVLNVPHEFENLAETVDPDQPIHAFRSAYMVTIPDDDLVRSIAERYASDILKVAPRGPIAILGQCQGGTIAVAVAQHLVELGRSVSLLILAEWSPRRVEYRGSAVLLYGRTSSLCPTASLPAIRATCGFAAVEREDVDGAYGTLYDSENVASIAAVIGNLLKRVSDRGIAA